MFDTVIKGGLVIDGTGGLPYPADIAIKGGRIVEVGTVTGDAREVIDADGAIVTPGFIDIHTHYDGQFLWDQTLEPSFYNGVTTAIAGNCGVGFAPARAENRKALIDIMEGAEDRRADINVIDFDKLESDLPRMVFDMPAGGPRFVQISNGYRATLVNGVITRRNDVATGATPGRLIRAQ